MNQSQSLHHPYLPMNQNDSQLSHNALLSIDLLLKKANYMKKNYKFDLGQLYSLTAVVTRLTNSDSVKSNSGLDAIDL